MTRASLLQVEYIPQPEWYFCGPACLAMVLSFFGITKDQYEMAETALTDEAVGTKHEGMVEAAQKAGMYVHQNFHATFDDLLSFLRRDIPVIVYIFSCDAGQKKYGKLDQMHYIVVVGYKDGNIILHDPDYAEGGRPMETMPVDEFVSLWESERSPDESWMMVLHDKPFEV